MLGKTSAPATELAGVIFDCDGVLVESEPVYAAAFSKALAQFGCNVPATTLQHALQGKSLPDCYAWLAKHWQFTVTAGFERALFDHTDALIPSLLQPIAWAQAVVRSVHAPKAVASNGLRRSVTTNLALCQLDHFFGQHIYTADQVEHPKPAPDVYLWAAQQLGIAPQRCAVVEDSATGVLAGALAGMQVCWLQAANPSQLDLEFLPKALHGQVSFAASMRDVHGWLAAKGLANTLLQQ